MDQALHREVVCQRQDRLHFLQAVACWVGIGVHRAEVVERMRQEAVEQGRRLAAEDLLTGADLSGAHLEGAYLNEAHLERTFLYKAHLERTFLYKAHLEGARLSRTHIEEARLRKALESGE